MTSSVYVGEAPLLGCAFSCCALCDGSSSPLRLKCVDENPPSTYNNELLAINSSEWSQTTVWKLGVRLGVPAIAECQI